jgi:hypothetical protein
VGPTAHPLEDDAHRGQVAFERHAGRPADDRGDVVRRDGLLGGAAQGVAAAAWPTWAAWVALGEATAAVAVRIQLFHQ